MEYFNVKTSSRSELVDITSKIQEIVSRLKIKDGVCCVFVPHTTAGITINENADPSVKEDIIAQLDKTIPWKSNYAHSEGNSAAHIKASLMGFSTNVIVENGTLQLGTWQGIYFAEFDGPRVRQVWVKLV